MQSRIARYPATLAPAPWPGRAPFPAAGNEPGRPELGDGRGADCRQPPVLGSADHVSDFLEQRCVAGCPAAQLHQRPAAAKHGLAITRHHDAELGNVQGPEFRVRIEQGYELLPVRRAVARSSTC